MILKQNTEAEISVESVLLALLSDNFCLIPQVAGPAGVTVEWSSKNRRHAT